MLIAIDPGVLHTGVVYMDHRSVVDVKTISYPRAVGIDNDALAERCDAIWRQLDSFLVDHPHEVVVIEGYVPYPGKHHGAHQTPWLCGALIAKLRADGEEVVIQTSKQVLNPRTRGNVAQVVDDLAEHKQLCPGSEKITNEHLRSAYAHGCYYLSRQR